VVRTVPHGYEEFDERTTLPEVIARRAADTPDRPFLVDITNDRALTYGEAHDFVLRWAGALRALGVSAGDRVAVMLPNCMDAVGSWLGIAWVRGYEVPLNTAFRGYMLEYLLNDSGATIAIVAERYLDRIEEVLDATPTLTTVIVPDVRSTPPALAGGRVRTVGADELFDGVGPADDLEPPAPWDIMTIAYTSGTTGPSKGVLNPWGAMIFGVGLMDDLTADDAIYGAFPMFHMSGKGMVAQAAYMGGKDVFREAFDTGAFWKDIDEHGCTFSLVVPAMAHWLLSQPPTPEDKEHSLRHAILSPIIHAFGERFGVTMRTHYGMTEAGNVTSRRNVTDDSPSCGKPRPGYEVRIVDEHDLEVPVGEVGELVVRTEQPWWTAIAYWNQPEKTNELWRNGWLHTGDGFRRDEEGNFYFVDRQKDAIRRRGENISSFEVEKLVLEHETVAECAAIGVETDSGEQEVKVCLVAHDGATIDPAELITSLIPRMPSFMVPRFVEVVDSLPKTEATMRVQKVKLREDPLNDRTWDRVAAGIQLPKDRR
jgi:crotonobetaine/carnitine-CoA ligase